MPMKVTMTTRPEWARPREASEIYGVSAATLQRAADAGKIRRAKTSDGRGGAVLYNCRSIEAWLDGRASAARPKYRATRKGK